MAPTKNDLKVGDLIEILRGLYRHWAVYVGDGDVVHLASASDVPGASANSLMSVPNEKALVKIERLRDVVGNSKWKINNSMDKKNKPRPVEDIVRDACAWVDETLDYSVTQHNCEHFVKGLRYGKAKSRQVWAGGLAMAISGGVLIASSIVVLPAIVIGAPLYVWGLIIGKKNK